jgi:hypothetical protein
VDGTRTLASSTNELDSRQIVKVASPPSLPNVANRRATIPAPDGSDDSTKPLIISVTSRNEVASAPSLVDALCRSIAALSGAGERAEALVLVEHLRALLGAMQAAERSAPALNGTRGERRKEGRRWER